MRYIIILFRSIRLGINSSVMVSPINKIRNGNVFSRINEKNNYHSINEWFQLRTIADIIFK